MNVFDKLDALPRLTPEEAELWRSVRRLAAERIAPRAAALDASGAFPWENVRDINALGLNAVFIPAEFGGADFSFAAYLLYVREISRACAATGITWATNFHASIPLLDCGSKELQSRIMKRLLEGGIAALALTEPSAGSDATAMRTTFTPDGDHVVVNGSKLFITNGGVADVYLVFGKWSELPQDKAAISLLAIDKATPGLDIVRLEDKMGHRASSTAALSFENCRVPRANLIGGAGSGTPLLHRFLNKSRPSVAAHALGIARAAFDDAVAYVNDRAQFGRRIVEFQATQFLLADLATDLALCERWLWHIAERVAAGEQDLVVEASMLKMRASDLAMRVATEAVQLHGGYGYCRDYRVERLMRDAKITQIWEGTNQIHRQIIGRSFARR
jgi:alkylation response protein AidB-like acyl-CoA dehydrogenase